ncbi:hypothetical protein [Helicobacter sp. MIT 01-3238]|uniref:hypothetical protein n=1 Tax=Helicobacter sp. MIT 01-3238 TaxID=398627 RepID=UPI0011C03AA8|nr:hypothetical protein [Helicobacter sp. MIT 01-3238]
MRYFASLDMTKEYKCFAQSHLSKVPKHDDALLYIVLQTCHIERKYLSYIFSLFKRVTQLLGKSKTQIHP